jgi:hypothetical protein
VSTGAVKTRQHVLVLYLSSSALDSNVIGWALHDGHAPHANGPGDSDEPPYRTGVAALADGWRLFQASPLLAAPAGQEYQTDYLKYEFLFEQLVEAAV